MLLAYVRQYIVIALLLIPAGVSADPFSQLIAFSGSLSDTGNFASVNGGVLPPPYFRNRISNGPVAIDILAAKFGLSAEPSLHLLGLQAGTNYATLHANAAGNLPIDLPAQIEAYLGPRGNIADPNALYFVFIGANDIIAAAIEPDERRAAAILREGITAIEDAIRRLVVAGAKTIYSPNNIDLGIAPIARDSGIADRVTEKTKIFNRLFDKLLDRLERELDIEIFRFDLFKFGQLLLASGDKLRFTNTTESCLALFDAGKCDFDRFSFFNELLPTARIHDLFGNALAISLLEQLNAPECRHGHRCDHGRRE